MSVLKGCVTTNNKGSVLRFENNGLYFQLIRIPIRHASKKKLKKQSEGQNDLRKQHKSSPRNTVKQLLTNQAWHWELRPKVNCCSLTFTACFLVRGRSPTESSWTEVDGRGDTVHLPILPCSSSIILLLRIRHILLYMLLQKLQLYNSLLFNWTCNLHQAYRIF